MKVSSEILLNSTILDEATFLQYKQITTTELATIKNQQPYEKARLYFKKVIKNGISIYSDMLPILSELTYLEFNQIIQKMKKSFYINSLFYGNFKDRQILQSEQTIQQFLEQDNNPIFTVNNIKTHNELMKSLNFHKEITKPNIYRILNDLDSELNDALINLYYVNKRDIRINLIMNMVQLLWENMFFAQLRTEKQLGYVVAALKYNSDDRMVYKKIFIFSIIFSWCKEANFRPTR
jgi:secreted Zn-dependent insulinase-like peptidase